MRFWVFFMLMIFASGAVAQDKPTPRKKQQQKQAAHKKPTPEQIRKFNELQKKQKQ